MTPLSMLDRMAAYNASPVAARYPSSRLWLAEEQGRQVVYGMWVMGQDYRNASALYGAHPHGYLERVMALFPDVVAEEAAVMQAGGHDWPTLHAFAGSLPPGPYVRLDLMRDAQRDPDVQANVYDVRGVFVPEKFFALVTADPPYSDPDAVFYGTPMVDRRRAMAALATVTAPGGHLVWLDTGWPMHRKADWHTVGRVGVLSDWEPLAEGWDLLGVLGVIRSTNQRGRFAHIFQRQP